MKVEGEAHPPSEDNSRLSTTAYYLLIASYYHPTYSTIGAFIVMGLCDFVELPLGVSEKRGL